MQVSSARHASIRFLSGWAGHRAPRPPWWSSCMSTIVRRSRNQWAFWCGFISKNKTIIYQSRANKKITLTKSNFVTTHTLCKLSKKYPLWYQFQLKTLSCKYLQLFSNRQKGADWIQSTRSRAFYIKTQATHGYTSTIKRISFWTYVWIYQIKGKQNENTLIVVYAQVC